MVGYPMITHPKQLTDRPNNVTAHRGLKKGERGLTFCQSFYCLL